MVASVALCSVGLCLSAKVLSRKKSGRLSHSLLTSNIISEKHCNMLLFPVKTLCPNSVRIVR